MTQEVDGKVYPSCMRIYDLHSFCISFRSQLNQVRRYGRTQECKDLFDGKLVRIPYLVLIWYCLTRLEEMYVSKVGIWLRPKEGIISKYVLHTLKLLHHRKY